MRLDWLCSSRVLRRTLGACLLIAGIFMVGCSKSSTPPAISVSLSPSTTQTLEQNATVTITATLANDTKAGGVTWTLTGAGTLSSSTTSSVTYNAPSSITSASTATVTATSVDDTTKTASLTINLVPPPTISGSNTPAGQVGVAYTGSVSATGGVGPYTWAMASSTTLPPGLSLSGTSSTVQIVGTPTTQGTYSFSVTVTDAGGFSATSGTLSITINAAAALQIATASPLASGNVGSPYSQTVAATGGLQPYTWSITATPGPQPTGLSIDASTGKISGTPTTTGTYTFTVNVQDSQATPATTSKQFSITINAAITNNCSSAPTGDEAKLTGQYAFFVQGFEGSGAGTPVAIAASFAPDGTGAISGGDLDITNSSGHSHLTINSSGSLYTVGADSTSSGDMGCVQLALSNNTTEVYHFSLGGLTSGSYTKGRIIRFDDTTGTGMRGSGILRQQTTSVFSTGDASNLSGNYAFGMDGVDYTGGHYALGGSFALNKSTGATTGQFDLDDASTLATDQTLAGNITGISSTTGRATVTFTSVTYSYNAVAYIIDANQMVIVTTDTFSSTQPILAGRVISTGSSFSSSSLNSNYVIHVSGSNSGTADTTLGLLTLSSGAVNGTLYQYQTGGTTIQSNSLSGGAYAVGSTTGRVTLSGGTGIKNPPVLYLTTASGTGVSAFVVGTDSSAIFGYAEKSTGTFSTSSLAAKYFFGTEDPSDNTVKDELGVVTVSSTGVITGTSDQSGSSSPYLKTGSVTGTVEITNSNGTGDIGTGTIAITNGSKLFFIDGSSAGPAVIHVVEKQ